MATMKLTTTTTPESREMTMTYSSDAFRQLVGKAVKPAFENFDFKQEITKENAAELWSSIVTGVFSLIAESIPVVEKPVEKIKPKNTKPDSETIKPLLAACGMIGHEVLNLSKSERTQYAVDLVRYYNFTLGEVGEKMKTSKSTVHDHLHGNCHKFGRGRNKMLSPDQEKIMLDEIIKQLLPLDQYTTQKLCKKVHAIALEKGFTPLLNNETKAVGRKWLTTFLQRYKLIPISDEKRQRREFIPPSDEKKQRRQPTSNRKTPRRAVKSSSGGRKQRHQIIQTSNAKRQRRAVKSSSNGKKQRQQIIQAYNEKKQRRTIIRSSDGKMQRRSTIRSVGIF